MAYSRPSSSDSSRHPPSGADPSLPRSSSSLTVPSPSSDTHFHPPRRPNLSSISKPPSASPSPVPVTGRRTLHRPATGSSTSSQLSGVSSASGTGSTVSTAPSSVWTSSSSLHSSARVKVEDVPAVLAGEEGRDGDATGTVRKRESKPSLKTQLSIKHLASSSLPSSHSHSHSHSTHSSPGTPSSSSPSSFNHPLARGDSPSHSKARERKESPRSSPSGPSPSVLRARTPDSVRRLHLDPSHPPPHPSPSSSLAAPTTKNRSGSRSNAIADAFPSALRSPLPLVETNEPNPFEHAFRSHLGRRADSPPFGGGGGEVPKTPRAVGEVPKTPRAVGEVVFGRWTMTDAVSARGGSSPDRPLSDLAVVDDEEGGDLVTDLAKGSRTATSHRRSASFGRLTVASSSTAVLSPSELVSSPGAIGIGMTRSSSSSAVPNARSCPPKSIGGAGAVGGGKVSGEEAMARKMRELMLARRAMTEAVAVATRSSPSAQPTRLPSGKDPRNGKMNRIPSAAATVAASNPFSSHSHSHPHLNRATSSTSLLAAPSASRSSRKKPSSSSMASSSVSVSASDVEARESKARFWEEAIEVKYRDRDRSWGGSAVESASASTSSRSRSASLAPSTSLLVPPKPRDRPSSPSSSSTKTSSSSNNNNDNSPAPAKKGFRLDEADPEGWRRTDPERFLELCRKGMEEAAEAAVRP